MRKLLPVVIACCLFLGILAEADDDTDGSQRRSNSLMDALVKQLNGKLPRYALEFDGQSSHVTVPSLHYDGSHPITIEAIVTPDKFDSVIVADTQRGGVGIGFWGDKYNTHAWNGRRYDVALSDKPAVLYLRVHIAGIFDDKKVSLFVNGKLQQIAPKLEGEFKASRFPMTIGASPSPRDPGCDFPFTGVIEAVHISKTVRYTRDFKPSYKFKADKDTLALFRFDEGKRNTASDASGNKHRGTLKGAKWVTDVAIRHRAAQGLAQIGRPALPALIEALDHENRDVRAEAVWALGQIGPDAKPVVPALNRALKDKDERVRDAAAAAIKRIDSQRKTEAPLVAIQDVAPGDHRSGKR